MQSESGITPNTTASLAPPSRHVTWPFWLLALLFYPYGPFFCLRHLRAITWVKLVGYLALAATGQIALVSVLAATNDRPWQGWVVMGLVGWNWIIGAIQFAIGANRQLWTPRAVKIWAIAAWVGGCLLLLSLVENAVLFHLAKYR